jgi:hypothetical protein
MSRSQTEQPANPTRSLDGEYPGLNSLTYAIGYLEQALSILSEPLLIGCSALAVVDFITGGGILALPLFTYLWASALAIAVTACFIVTWRRALRAFGQNRYVASFFLALLGMLLGLVDWTAVATQSLQQALHIGFVPALRALGVDVFWITNIRAAVAISMAIVVAISNHTAVTTAHAPKRRLAAWDSLLDRIAPVVEQQPAHVPAQIEQEREQQRRESKRQERLKVIHLKGDTEPLERVRRALEQEPGCSDRQLGRLTQMAPATAKKYREMLTHSREQAM